MLEFNIAAEASEASEDDDYVEIPLGDKVFRAYRPTVAQGALLVATRGTGNVGMAFKLIRGIVGDEFADIIEEAVWNRRLDFDDLVGGGTELNPDHGLLDGIFEQFGERPTKPSTVSSSTPERGGRKSTGRSPGKGSIPSPSRSTGS